MSMTRFGAGRGRWLAAIALAGAALLQGCTGSGATFAAPEAAATALVEAARSGDKDEMARVLGSGSEGIITSGDDVEDSAARATFVSAYDEGHRIEPEEDGSRTLVVGASDWPLPIPIVSDGPDWRFDSVAGADIILTRRIGRNELDTIETCRAVVDAQRDYVAMDPMGTGSGEYARKFLSDPGARNGLYWPVDAGATQSPLGELVVSATAEGYTRGEGGAPTPYHGYYYRMLTAQGASAPGGARDYVAGGRMTGGFAVVAYPAEYGRSGIKTFMVSRDGVVYECDLGDSTGRIASAMTAFDPGPEWDVVEE